MSDPLGTDGSALRVDALRHRVVDVGSVGVTATYLAALAWIYPELPIDSSVGLGLTILAVISGLFAVLARSAPYRARAIALLIAMFSGEAIGALHYGYVSGTTLLALMCVALAGILLGARWAAAGWAVSSAVFFAVAVLVGTGAVPTQFDPAMIDPRHLTVGLRFAAIYTAFSGVLAFGVIALVNRLVASLDETEGALARLRAAQGEREQAEEAKRTTEAEFKSLVDNAPELILIVDRKHCVEFVNQYTLDVETEDVIGHRAESFVVPDHADRVSEAIETVFATGEPSSYEVQVLFEGERHWFATRVGPVMHENKVARVVLISNDIQERRNLEEQLLQAQKLEAVGQLTGGVAHDFNNLLTVILGNLELVAAELDPDDPGLEFTRAAREATNRGAALTHRLLAFARRQTLQPQVIDLQALVVGMDPLLRRTLGEAIEIETMAAGGLWKCEADPAQLENVILNLAINARDAMPDGGKLTLETSNVVLDQHSFQDVDPGEYLLVAVSDTGVGMSPEILRHVYEPFFTTKEVGRGSGLGLSMVYGFVRQSGGQIAMYSEPGRGTSVKVYLPRALGSEEEKAERVATDDLPRGTGECVLVVEDDEPLRGLTVQLLEELGYETLEAVDAVAALEILASSPDVALVLTDVVLPRQLSGADLAVDLAASHPELPVLFMSGYAEHAVIRGGQLERGSRLLQKPFSRVALAQKVAAVLREPRPS